MNIDISVLILTFLGIEGNITYKLFDIFLVLIVKLGAYPFHQGLKSLGLEEFGINSEYPLDLL